MIKKSKKEVVMFQQGDVVLVRVKEVKGKKLGHLTLAQGEVTGHNHTITEGEAELYEQEGTLFLRVKSDEAILTHQEHGAVVLPQGDYKVNIIREYDHFAEEARNVRD